MPKSKTYVVRFVREEYVVLTVPLTESELERLRKHVVAGGDASTMLLALSFMEGAKQEAAGTGCRITHVVERGVSPLNVPFAELVRDADQRVVVALPKNVAVQGELIFLDTLQHPEVYVCKIPREKKP